MTDYNFPKSSGALFINDKRTKDNHPHFRGHVEVTSEQIKKLIEMGKSGREVRLRLAAWKRISAAGEKYVSLETEAFMPQEEKKPEQNWDDADDDGWGDAPAPSSEPDIPF